MIWGDWHVHSNFCDGKNSPWELCSSAAKKGMCGLGIVFHSYTDFDESYCIKKEDIPLFFDEIKRLKAEYGGDIKIFGGVEQDLYSGSVPAQADFVIGSCHYVKLKDKYIPVDENKEILKKATEEYFGGSFLRLCEEYYAQKSTVAKKTGCDFVGHFDLITKFNDGEALFAENSQKYKDFALFAAEEILKNCSVFELNTGAIFRGYKNYPYPSKFILKFLKEKNADIILSGDAHCKDSLCFKFKEAEELLKSLGFDRRVVFENGRFEKVKI